MSAHPNDVEKRDVLVYADHRGIRAVELHREPVYTDAVEPHAFVETGPPTPLGPLDLGLGHQLFEEVQADGELRLGGAFRVEATHGSSRSGPAHLLEGQPWPGVTPGA